MRASDRSGVAVMISVALASITLRPLTSDGSYLILGWLLIGLIGGTSIVLRRLRMGGSTVLATQVLLWLLCSLGLGLVSPSSGAPWYAQYAELWAAGIEHMRTQASPMEPNDGTRLIFVTVIGLIMIMTDLLVSGISRPAWAVAPPATLFLVPALGLSADTGVASFLMIALGYLGILLAEGLNTAARWTRGLARDSAEGFGEATPVVWRATAYLGVPALVTAILLGVALPTLSLPGFGFGTGGSGGPLQLTDPTLDLRRNLSQSNDRLVIEYQSRSPGGVYLRMASLPRLNETGWNSVPIELNSGSTLSAVPGLGRTVESRTTDIHIRDFRSQYLPVPYAPRGFDAPGDWRYDPLSLVVLNGDGRPDDLPGLEYSVDSAEITPSAEDLAESSAGVPADVEITTELPDDLPRSLIELSREVIDKADAETPAAKAAAIQSFLRDGDYQYSVQPLPGMGYQALENFLLDDKLGYCEQFASAMAMMARVAGIPSRVAVGFLPGERVGDSWQVSIRDMHAWPELYFSTWGWVRFEPTPSVQTGEAPPWTLQPADGPTDDPTAEPSASESTGPSATTDPRDTPAETPVTAEDTDGAGWLRTLLWSGAGLVLLLILAAPATIRVRRRSQRLSSDGAAEDQVESAWAEIRDTVVDHGGAWPSGSPRAIGQEVSSRLDTEEAASMGRVATLVERARYARTFTDTEAASDLPAVTQEIRHAIAAPMGPGRRLLAVVLPRSLFPRRKR
ncbi:MAG TPA: transglutaminaseTgpA domain-containing protein [Propionibacteriaceae bacterium]|nr:transglutaminaseTgpA domain-containing protein [Propionibacteriaceae bacterium]